MMKKAIHSHKCRKKREWRAIFMCYPHNWELKQMELHTHKRKHIVKKRVTSGSKNRSVRFIIFILYIFLLLVCARQNVRALVHFAIHAFFVGWFIVFMIPPTQKIILPYSHHCVYLLCSTRADLFFLHRHSVIFLFSLPYWTFHVTRYAWYIYINDCT